MWCSLANYRFLRDIVTPFSSLSGDPFHGSFTTFVKNLGIDNKIAAYEKEIVAARDSITPFGR